MSNSISLVKQIWRNQYKYGNEISVIVNNNKFGNKLYDLTWSNKNLNILDYCQSLVNQANDCLTDNIYENCNFTDIDYWLFANKAAEWSYIGLTEHCGWKAQDARDILPIDTKSTLIHISKKFLMWMDVYGIHIKLCWRLNILDRNGKEESNLCVRQITHLDLKY